MSSQPPRHGLSAILLAAAVAGIDLREQPKPEEAPKPKRQIGRHKCHAVGCPEIVPPEMLMCKEHWRSLPEGMRKRVLMFYVAGQCHDIAKIKPSWVAAARTAIEHVLQRELRTLVARIKLPEGYDAALVTVRRVGMSTIAITHPDKPMLAASLETGEVREIKQPSDADPGDEAKS